MPARKFVLQAATVLLALTTGCSGIATSTVGRRGMGRHNAYALASCTDTVSCCIQRNPGVPEACGLTAGESAAHIATMDAAMRRANEKEDEDDADDGWKEHCINTYVACRDQKKPRWEGDCYACFRRCEGQKQWPFKECHQRR
ncbi:hypothetical protein [Myxococcus sp. AB036A]|uniref:hypothetical protein n=1 Tax=Myxococcus sp. AB036A TaxID=2562793 RepID=UPI00114791A8|nr:hypothetical protein [Myxococcus sp. AB036A]